MRQQQNNKNRMRGRGRKPQNNANRNYESNGPDVKIRGNAAHIAEKYATLARDALSAGDRVIAENYLQHAEHYNRIVLANNAARDEAQVSRDDSQRQHPDYDDDDDQPDVRAEAGDSDDNDDDADGRETDGRDNAQRRPRRRDAKGENRSDSRGENRGEGRGDNRGENRSESRGENRADNRGERTARQHAEPNTAKADVAPGSPSESRRSSAANNVPANGANHPADDAVDDDNGEAEAAAKPRKRTTRRKVDAAEKISADAAGLPQGLLSVGTSREAASVDD